MAMSSTISTFHLAKCYSLFRLGQQGQRAISISCLQQGQAGPRTNIAFKQSRIMKKLMTGSSHSRKKLYTVDQAPSKEFTEFGVLSGKLSAGTPRKSNKCLRRVQVLNTLFMEQITGLMSTGEISAELVGKGITVSKVKVSSDFSKVNVYWIATGTTVDEIVEPLLRRAGGKLRHELSQLRVIGIVPPIEFIKDSTFSKVIEVQTLLDKCDFGEDFVPTSPRNYFAQTNPSSKFGSKLHPGLTNSPLNEQDIFNKKNEVLLDEPPKTETDLYSSSSNPMRQDMLGLRHDVIMTEVKQMMNKIVEKKTTQLCREDDIEPVELAFPVENGDTSPILASKTATRECPTVQISLDKHRRDNFLKYLRNQQLSRAKQLKRESTSVKEREFYDEEAFQRWKNFIDKEFILDEELDREDDVHDHLEDVYLSKNDNA